MTTRRVLVLAALALLVTAVAPTSVAAARRAAGARSVGASPAERRALTRILRKLEPTHIRRVELFLHRNDGRTRLVLSVDAVKTLRGEWEAQVLAHLYRLRTARL